MYTEIELDDITSKPKRMKLMHAHQMHNGHGEDIFGEHPYSEHLKILLVSTSFIIILVLLYCGIKCRNFWKRFGAVESSDGPCEALL